MKRIEIQVSDETYEELRKMAAENRVIVNKTPEDLVVYWIGSLLMKDSCGGTSNADLEPSELGGEV